MSVGQVINDLLAHVLILPSKSTRLDTLPGISRVGWAVRCSEPVIFHTTLSMRRLLCSSACHGER